MLKYKVTNTSPKTEKGARNVFLIEAGKLLKPGDQCAVNRLDSGTRAMAEAGVLSIAEGSFAPAPIFPPSAPETPAPAEDDGAAAAKDDAEVAAQAAADKADAEAKAKVVADSSSSPKKSKGKKSSKASSWKG